MQRSTICTASIAFRKKAQEGESLKSELSIKKKQMNDLRLERNIKVLGTVDGYQNMTVGELASSVGRTIGIF